MATVVEPVYNEVSYKTETDGTVKAFMKQDGLTATNPAGIFLKDGATNYIVKSRVTDEEYTVSTGKDLAGSKASLELFLKAENIYNPAP